MTRWIALPLFLLVTVGGGALIGGLTPPDAWYRALEKPAFNPPDWVFAPVWTALYVLIGIAGWRLWRQTGNRRAFGLWIAQMALNFLWSPVFFGAHSARGALGVIVLLLSAVIALIVVTWRTSRTVSYLLMPYAAWVAFASALNAAIVMLN